MTTGSERKCPLCERKMFEAVCPEDRMATLLVHGPTQAIDPPRSGDVLAGRYEVRDRIGQGGYGWVYRARHLGTGHDIALKILKVPPEEDGAFAVQRFFLEARVTSGLTHPNTVQVFDFGQDDSGCVFLAMELLAGRTLREELRVRKARGTRFSDAEIVQIGVSITKSLSEAHEQGLVHRDLKPDNVFLHRVAGDDPVVKVLDFGIAKLGSGHEHTLSSDTSVPGTPAYMAPEHALNLQVDGRTDLYALGVVLYQLATLELPFQAASDPQTLYMQAYGDVPDPRAVCDVGGALAHVIMGAMQKKPEARPENARAMRLALSECLVSGSGLGSDRITPAPSRRVEAQPMATAPIDVIRPRTSQWGWPLAGAGLLIAAGLWFALRPQTPESSIEPPVPVIVAAPLPSDPIEPQPALVEVAPTIVQPVDAGLVAAPKKKRVRVRRRRAKVRRAAPATSPPAPKNEDKEDVLNMRLEDLLEQP